MDDEPEYEDEEEYDPIYGVSLTFDSDHPEFTRGFEVGILWVLTAAACENDLEVQKSIHFSNAEMILRVAAARNMTFKAEPTDDEEWLLVTFTPPREPE